MNPARSDLTTEPSVKENKLRILDPSVSPFTWQTNDNLALNYVEDQEREVGFDEQPIIALIEAVVMVYINTKRNRIFHARKKINEAIDMLEKIRNLQLAGNGISVEVLQLIVKATEYDHKNEVLVKRSSPLKKNKLKAVATEYIHSQDDHNVVHSTLIGCKSIFWSLLKNYNTAIKLSQEAMITNPQCALWYFTFSLNLRYLRLHDNFGFKPGNEESVNFLLAYKLSEQNDFFGVNLAQMFLDCNEQEKAKQMYMNIYNNNPQSVEIRLRLALAFMNFRNFKLAKECLDWVKKINPSNLKYFQYKYIFYIKQRNFKMFQCKMITPICFPKDELPLIKLMLKRNPHFDYIAHLENAIKNTEIYEVKQQLTLHMAMLHFFKRRDMRNSLISFENAISIDKNNLLLKNFHNILVDQQYYNIFCFVQDTLLCEFNKVYPRVPESLKSIYSHLKNL